MKINTKYLKDFIKFDLDTTGLKSLLETMGFEVEEIIKYKGVDVIEVEVTPNRPDWLSHNGIARDMYAKDPSLALINSKNKTQLVESNNNSFDINIKNSDDCPRYSGCIIKNIKVSESSNEIKELLLSLGLRPINSIVDVSNLILITYGHPIHIFDLDKIEGNEINIRRAEKGEKLVLLDEQNIELNEEFLVIADKNKPVALAGIIGGIDSGVTIESKNIFIESAVFNPVVVRKSARRIGLSTDASFRFERGTDILCTRDILEKTVDKLAKVLSQDIKIGYFDDMFPENFANQTVIMEKEFPAKYSGIDIKHDDSENILNRLGFKTEDKGMFWNVTVPSYRVDIYGKQDLIEEIVRIYGYDNLKSVLPSLSTDKIKKWPERELRKTIGQRLINIGAFEVLNYSFHTKEDNSFFADENLNVEIKNPLGLGFSIMRNSLIPGVLKNTGTNMNQSVKFVFLYEFGSVFSLKADTIDQKNKLVISASGIFQKSNWMVKADIFWNFFLFKSILANLSSRLFIEFEFKKSKINYFKNGVAFDVLYKGDNIGVIGELKDEVLANYKLDKPVYIAEVDMQKINEIKKVFKLKKWNVFPSTKRDFSFYIDKNNDYENIKNVINNNKPENLINFELFDMYEGKGNPENKISLSMSFTYQDELRTLENNEVNEMHEKFIKTITEKLKLTQR